MKHKMSFLALALACGALGVMYLYNGREVVAQADTNKTAATPTPAPAPTFTPAAQLPTTPVTSTLSIPSKLAQKADPSATAASSALRSEAASKPAAAKSGAEPVLRPAASAAPDAAASDSESKSLGLTRQLGTGNTLMYDNRERSVLGTKETTNQNGTQTVLVTRDNRTGQIDYWQPALRIVLQPGNDYEAFIKERSALTRRFVNSEHAQVSVDAAAFAREFGLLSSDPRVASVDFMQVSAPLGLK